MAWWKEHPILHVTMFLSFLVSGLLVNLVQAVFYIILVKLFNLSHIFRTINFYFIYFIYGQLLFLADWWSGSKLVFHTAPEVVKEMGQDHAIILMNHHYELDWLYGWMVGDRCGVLGNCRVFVKKMLKYVPIIGWAWSFSDTVFLARNWDKDKEHLSSSLTDLMEYPSPVWVLLFPEGTRFNQEKYQASKQFAEQRGLPVLQHCLFPRTKGFTFTRSHLDTDKVPWVYDVTLGCDMSNPDTAPTMTNVLLGRPTEAHMYIRKYKLKDIPSEEVAASQWLQDRFVEKDKLLDSFHSTGQFNCPGLPSYPGTELPARPYTLILMIFVQCFVMGPILTYCLLCGTWVTLLSLSAVVGLLMVGMKYFINITKISNSSDYGNKDK